MKKEDVFYSYNGVSLEQSPPTIIVKFSDPDQGGTQLNFHFYFEFYHNFKDLKIILKVGYTHDKKWETKEINNSNLPNIVIEKLFKWIKKEKDCISENHNLFIPLNKMEVILKIKTDYIT